GEAVEDDDQAFHAREARDRRELAVVQERLVDLVGEDRNPMPLRDLGDAAELIGLEDATRRVLRRVDDDELRARRRPALEEIEVEPESRFLPERDRHRDAPDE